MAFRLFQDQILTFYSASAAPTFNIFGGGKDASTEKKDALTGNVILRP
jgi:hypothetical protein